MFLSSEYKKKAEKRFWTKVDKKGDDECWNWTGSIAGQWGRKNKLGIAKKTNPGYGHFRTSEKGHRKMRKANRFSYEIEYGEIPKGKCVLHSCDNSICVNPKHLYIGTHKDNMNDMVKRNRSTTGEKNGCAKLSEKNVMDIKTCYKNSDFTALGSKKTFIEKFMKKYNVSRGCIQKIIYNIYWTHVTV